MEILIFLPIQISLTVVHKKINRYIVVKQTRGCNTVAVKSAFDDILSSLHMSPCWRVAISRALLYFTLSTITIEIMRDYLQSSVQRSILIQYTCYRFHPFFQAILHNDETVKRHYLHYWVERTREKLDERQLEVSISIRFLHQV